MKKILVLILAILTLIAAVNFAEVPAEIPVPELRGMAVDDTDAIELDAYIKGYALLVNAYYSDAQRMMYSRDIARMGALNVIKKESGMEFLPEEFIIKQDLIEALVRLSGQEATVVQNVMNNAVGMSDAAVERMKEDEYRVQAIALGFMTADEEIGLRDPVTKEQAALWLAKVLGLAETFQSADNVHSFGDWRDITPSSRAYIETLVTEAYMAVDNDGNFNPKRNITKGEMAYILNNAVSTMYGTLGVEAQVGLIIGEKSSTVQETGNTINERRLIVRNMDGTVTTILTSKNLGTKQRQEFVTLKNDIASLSNMIKPGDQVEYLIQNGQVIYMEVYNDGSIKEQIKRESDDADNLNIYYGYINKRISEEKWEDGSYLDIDRLRTTIYNGLVFDIVVEDNQTTGIRNDIIVYKDDKIGGVDLLEEGDVVELLVKDEKNIVYVKVSDPTQGQVSGTVRFVDTDQETGMTMLTIFDYDDKIKKYEVTSYADIVINHELAQVSDLKYGQDVTLNITNGYVTKISGETFINPGFIPDYSKMRNGSVVKVTEYGDLKVKYESGSYETIEVPTNTTIIKGGNIISIHALQEGDQVKLYFNDIYSSVTSLIEVEGKEQLIQNIYRGLVQDVNVYRNELTIVEPAVLNNAQWKNDEELYSKTFDVPDDVGIYVRGEKIDLTELSKLYRQKPVYIAIKDAYSTEEVVQISVAIGGEHFASDRIEDVDKVIGNFELQDNNANVVFNEGTIFVKNSKLVDASVIDQWDDVIVVSDYYRGQDNANIVRITSDAERIFDNIHIGAIEDVYGYAFSLRNYATISGNQWSDVNRSKSALFFYFNELDIKDITDKRNHKTLSSYEFYHGGYSREENENPSTAGLDYLRYYTFFVTDDDRKVVGMNIRQMGLLDNQNLDLLSDDEEEIKEKLDVRLANLVLTRGSIASFDDDWQRIEITDSHDWAEDFGRWNANRANSSVEYRDTIFVKNGERIEREDLNLGDYIYVLRDDEDALVVIVEVR